MLHAVIRAQAAAGAAQSIAAVANDELLVERIACGDRLAMQALFTRHRTPVYRWLVRFVNDAPLAEDLLSEVFLDVWRQAGRFEGRSTVSTWIVSIARYKALAARRRRTHAELNEQIEATIADTSVDPETAFEKKARNEILCQALTRLSLEHRQVIDLVYSTRNRWKRPRRFSKCLPRR